MKINEWPRHGIQALWAALTNSHISGFVTGKIYTGKLKNVCVPGLNCYSCPGARGACPIGSLQAVIGSWNFKMAYYVAGFLIFVGALLGRLVCGISLPLWTDPGSVEQDSFSKEDPDISGRQAFEKTEICDLSCICDPTSHVCSRYHGPGSTIFLQADLPGRNAGGRYPSGAAEQIHAKCGRLAVHVEKYDPGDHHYLINYDIPAIL